jgi:transposase
VNAGVLRALPRPVTPDSAGIRIFVCTEPVDLRQGFDRLAQRAREVVGQDPQQGGALFVFANKRASRIKVLC